MIDNDEAADRSDFIEDLQGQLKDAKALVAAMTMTRDPAKMDDVALQAACAIEDIFVRGADGVQIDGKWITPTQVRRNAIQNTVRLVIENAIAGGETQ